MIKPKIARAIWPIVLGIRNASGRREENTAKLAPRLHLAIAEQEDRSERLVGWFQLSIVVTFAILFAIAPKQLPIPVWQRAAAWVIAAYLLFTLFRLAASFRSRLPSWLLGLSVVADVALLMVLIWSFHIEYAQPPSFSLKAPTLLYVFIFIALRALRFDARYVLLVGIASAVGWGAMILYAVAHDSEGAGSSITRNYVTYLTSNSVLLGAEFDKIISILIVTIVLAAAIVRARSLLVKSVAEQAAAGALARFFSPEIAERIRGSPHEIRPGEGQLRDAAVLYVDVRTFTQISASMPANEVIALLVEYERRVVPIVQRHGGVVDKFIGDGILATFGCVEPNTTYAADSLLAAQEIAAMAKQWAEERAAAGTAALEIGIGIASGRVVFGAIGDATQLDFTVIGDAVNLAAKLEKHSKSEGARALTTVETYRLAMKQGLALPARVEQRHSRKVEGVTAPIDLVVICSPDHSPSPKGVPR